MISARRSERRTHRLWAALLLGAGLGGCVSLPEDSAPHEPQIAQDISGPSSAEAASEPEAPARDDSQAQRDLWNRIRDGFSLTVDNRDRAEIRDWTQFYASRKRHLRDTAEAAKPYLWHIVEALEQRDMPTEIALLPIMESSFDPFAGGGQRATGLWQFMPVTARRFGLERDDWYEGRRDVLRSTDAALDYLSWLHGRFDGDWLLALAAYNAGEGRVDQAIERARAQDRSDDYWHLELPTQTERYIPKLLALKELVLDSERYAIQWPNVPDTPAFEVVELPARTSLTVAASMLNLPEKRLRQLNPALRGDTTKPGGPHRLLVPADQADEFRNAVDAIEDKARLRWLHHRVQSGESLGDIAQRYQVSLSALKDHNGLRGGTIQPGRQLRIPDRALPETGNKTWTTYRYRVQSGDSLWRIAHRHEVSVEQLRAWNNLPRQATLQPGQVLKLRTGKQPDDGHYTVRAGDSLWSIARRFDTNVANLRQWNTLATDHSLQPGERLIVRANASRTVYYKVRQGDSLWSIASQFQVQIAQLKAWNDLGSRHLIKPGQRLKIIVTPTG